MIFRWQVLGKIYSMQIHIDFILSNCTQQGLKQKRDIAINMTCFLHERRSIRQLLLPIFINAYETSVSQQNNRVNSEAVDRPTAVSMQARKKHLGGNSRYSPSYLFVRFLFVLNEHFSLRGAVYTVVKFRVSLFLRQFSCNMPRKRCDRLQRVQYSYNYDNSTSFLIEKKKKNVLMKEFKQRIYDGLHPNRMRKEKNVRIACIVLKRFVQIACGVLKSRWPQIC